jgi:L-histidine Nalpha-methyltransferase
MASGPADDVLRSRSSPVLSRLGAVLRELDPPRWIELVEDHQTDKFANLLADLRDEYSTTGDGKRITSGYAYIGMEPAIAWSYACQDRLYPVMRQSIESFASRWSTVRPSLAAARYHYVSLGPGDGQKDAVILRDLQQNNVDLCYVPVDTSTDMLRLAVHDLMIQLPLSAENILSLPLDFSAPDNIATLRRMLAGLFDDTPVLFSLLGNTLANFDDDIDLLRMLAKDMLRPQDRLLLEVATTPDLDEHLADEAAYEYKRSQSFGEFVTSALRRYTNLNIKKDSVLYKGSVEDDHSLLIKMIYQNQTDDEIQIQLPAGDPVCFRPNDTIRLLLTRKYTKQAIDSLLDASGVSTIDSFHADFAAAPRRPRFGMDLMILASQPKEVEPEEAPLQETSPANNIWSR